MYIFKLSSSKDSKTSKTLLFVHSASILRRRGRVTFDENVHVKVVDKLYISPEIKEESFYSKVDEQRFIKDVIENT